MSSFTPAHLAPDIQEAILFLPRVAHGRDPIHLQQPAGVDYRFGLAKPALSMERNTVGGTVATTTKPHIHPSRISIIQPAP